MKKKIYEAPTTIVFVTTLQNILAGSTGSTGGGTSEVGGGGGGSPDKSDVGISGGGDGSDGGGNEPFVDSKLNTNPWREWDD